MTYIVWKESSPLPPLDFERISNSSWQTWHFKLVLCLTRQRSGWSDRTRPATRTSLPVCTEQMCPLGCKQIKKKCFYLHRRAHLFSSSHSGPLAVFSFFFFFFTAPVTLSEMNWKITNERPGYNMDMHPHTPIKTLSLIGSPWWECSLFEELTL